MEGLQQGSQLMVVPPLLGEAGEVAQTMGLALMLLQLVVLPSMAGAEEALELMLLEPHKRPVPLAVQFQAPHQVAVKQEELREAERELPVQQPASTPVLAEVAAVAPQV